jgi:hypothetical protein
MQAFREKIKLSVWICTMRYESISPLGRITFTCENRPQIQHLLWTELTINQTNLIDNQIKLKWGSIVTDVRFKGLVDKFKDDITCLKVRIYWIGDYS